MNDDLRINDVDRVKNERLTFDARIMKSLLCTKE